MHFTQKNTKIGRYFITKLNGIIFDNYGQMCKQFITDGGLESYKIIISKEEVEAMLRTGYTNSSVEINSAIYNEIQLQNLIHEIKNQSVVGNSILAEIVHSNKLTEKGIVPFVSYNHRN